MKLDGELDLIVLVTRTLVAVLLGVYLAGSVVLGVVQYAGIEVSGPRVVRRAPMACVGACATVDPAVRAQRPDLGRSRA